MHTLVFINYWIEKCTVKQWNSQIQRFLKIRHLQQQQDETGEWILSSHLTLTVRISCKIKFKKVIERCSVLLDLESEYILTLSQTLLYQTRIMLTAKQVWDATLKKRYERDSHTLPQSIERSLSCRKIMCFSLTSATKSPRGYDCWKSLTFLKGSPFYPMKGIWPWHQARIPQEYPTATTRNNIHELCNYLKSRVYQEINTRTLKYTRG